MHVNLEEEVRALRAIRDLGRHAVYLYPGQAYHVQDDVPTKAPEISLDVLSALQKDGLLKLVGADLWSITHKGVVTLEQFEGVRR